MNPPQPSLSLTAAAIVCYPDGDATVQFAAAELSRFLYLLTGRASPVTDETRVRGVNVRLRAENPATAGGIEPLERQGYRIGVVDTAGQCEVRIAGESPVGTLYGVYRLLEELGMGFYAGGETYPDRPADARIPTDLDLRERPHFRVRGNLLHYNFLCGCTIWGLEDYKFYFDQLARMRGNLLLMHWYDDEPGAAYDDRGEVRKGGRTPNSLAKPWGAKAALRTSQFSFGTGRLFDEEIVSSPAGEDLPDTLTEIRRTEAMFADATAYARTAGIQVAAGFEAPREDPTDPDAVRRFQARVAQFLRRNPDITHFALWQHESGGCVGTEPPEPGTAAASLLEERRAHFAYLGNEQRVWEAIRLGRFAEHALAVVDRERPGLPMVMVGWGGDRWMRFADYCLGYDKLLPASVVFTCHDNIEASYGPNVSTPWGELPPERERWATVWVENDLDDCQVRQPEVESLGTLAPDALQKGCQGLLTMQWRTRDVEEETAFATQFAWDPALTPDTFYRRVARHGFGADQELRTSQHVADLQRLGARWTGVRGSVECGHMKWTGWIPHFPFELDGRTADFLIDKMDAVIAALAEVPEHADSEAAFHLIQGDDRAAGDHGREEQKDGSDAGGLDGSRGDAEAMGADLDRPGIREMRTARERLRSLRGLEDQNRLRRELRAIEEDVFAVRPELVRFGMTSKSYQAVDGFLIAIHHLQRNAGATAHYAELQRIREDLLALRREFIQQRRVHRLERLDYLLNTMDFAMHHDRAAMLLADGERVEQALADAQQAAQASLPAHDSRSAQPEPQLPPNPTAAEIAGRAYTDLVDAGMQQALEAFARKLTTRCDFGTLCTLNVKSLPLYWKAIGELEAFLPAVPPRELTARGQEDEIWISWKPGRCTGQNLYRRSVPDGDWQRVNAQPLQAATECFVDRDAPSGKCEYCVTALDENCRESPKSHRAAARCGRERAPRIVACKPAGRFRPEEEIPVRVVVHSDLPLRQVRAVHRRVGTAEWRTTRLQHRFRDSHAGFLPTCPTGEILEYYVEATDACGNQALWPQTAPDRGWTVITATPSCET